jgi:hypothetical protein
MTNSTIYFDGLNKIAVLRPLFRFFIGFNDVRYQHSIDGHARQIAINDFRIPEKAVLDGTVVKLDTVENYRAARSVFACIHTAKRSTTEIDSSDIRTSKVDIEEFCSAEVDVFENGFGHIEMTELGT